MIPGAVHTGGCENHMGFAAQPGPVEKTMKKSSLVLCCTGKQVFAVPSWWIV
jgi:hypothetical protein